MAGKMTAALSGTFRIGIPKAVRAARGWEAGQVLAFVPKGAGVMLVPVPTKERLRGIAKGADVREFRERERR